MNIQLRRKSMVYYVRAYLRHVNRNPVHMTDDQVVAAVERTFWLHTEPTEQTKNRNDAMRLSREAARKERA